MALLIAAFRQIVVSLAFPFKDFTQACLSIKRYQPKWKEHSIRSLETTNRSASGWYLSAHSINLSSFKSFEMVSLMRHLLTGAILFTLVNGCIMKSNQSTFETYTLGIWSLKPGHKAEFIRTWTAFAEWNTRHLEGSGKAHLLQDEKDPLRFISFGPWESNDIIQLWRETDEFKDFVVELTALCERFEPNTLRVVSGTP